MKKIIFIFVLILSSICACSTTLSSKPNWDLTYEKLLYKKKSMDFWLLEWMNRNKRTDAYVSPIKEELENWKDGNIVSSFLLEGPEYHSGHEFCVWAVETPDKVDYYLFFEYSLQKKISKISKSDYYDLFNVISNWKQLDANLCGKDYIDIPIQAGYFGYLSIFKDGYSKQIKISAEEYLGKDCSESSKENNIEKKERDRFGVFFNKLLFIFK